MRIQRFAVEGAVIELKPGNRAIVRINSRGPWYGELADINLDREEVVVFVSKDKPLEEMACAKLSPVRRPILGEQLCLCLGSLRCPSGALVASWRYPSELGAEVHHPGPAQVLPLSVWGTT